MPRFLLAIALALGCSASSWPLLNLPAARRRPLLLALALAALATPLLIPAEERWWRLVAAVIAVLHVFKLGDLHLHMRRLPRPSPGELFTYLLSPFGFVLRRLPDEPRPSRAQNRRAIAFGLLNCASGVAIEAGLFKIDWTGCPLLIEHALKLLALFFALGGLLHAAVAMVRSAGIAAREPLDNPFIAVTPADFWRRYNRLVGQAFHENVFMIFSGRRHPLRTTLLVFFLSGVMHEYIFGIAIGAVQGLQLAFFMLQGVAVAATLRMRPKGKRRLLGIAGTFAFNVVTSLLFFDALDQVIPIWSHPVFR